MAVTQCMPTSAKAGFLAGTYVAADVYKIALYTQAAATWNATSTTYSTTGELATAGGYTQGGLIMSVYAAGSSGNTTTGVAWIDFTVDPQWTSATFTADSAVIYNSSKGNALIAILVFGSAAVSSGTFTIQLPTADASNAIIRIS